MAAMSRSFLLWAGGFMSTPLESEKALDGLDQSNVAEVMLSPGLTSLAASTFPLDPELPSDK